jgi:hypothetical protein
MIAGVGEAIQIGTVFEADGNVIGTGKLNDFLDAGVLAAFSDDDAVEGGAGFEGFADGVNAGETVHGESLQFKVES